MHRISLLIIVLLLFSFLSAEVISQEELHVFNQMLNKVELDTTALNFPKNWAGSASKLNIVKTVLDSPLVYADFLDSLKFFILDNNYEHFFWETISQVDTLTYHTNPKQEIFAEIDIQFSLAKSNQDFFEYLDFVSLQAIMLYQESLINLSHQERVLLSQFIVSLRSEGQEKYDNFLKSYIENEDLEIEDIIEIIDKIDFSLFFQAGKIYEYGVQKTTEFTFAYKDEIIEYQSQFGLYAIGTNQTDIYKKRYSFIIDPEGDDLYLADIFADFYQPFYAVFDLKGNDTYRNETFAHLFSTLFGFGFSYDFSGNDFYKGDDFLFSANFGINIHKDLQGDDQYRAENHSLAAASYGLAVLEDSEGNDSYIASEYSEGFAGPQSLGAIIDYAGSDQYYSGGRFRHAPLAPFDFRSLSQGCSFGVRPDIAGGVGLIFDKDGNDYYNGGVFSQAVGYWYGLGIIMDLTGNDSYHSVYYPQGSGIHLAGGFLYDEQGEDSYYSKHGPGQGAGHDYGVGFLVDRSGNDAYSVEGGNGLGLTNSVGIFLDVSGDDRYERKQKDSYGYGKVGRNSGSIGLFLDTGGNDIYANENLSDNSQWIQPLYGIGLDTLMVKKQTATDKLAESQKELISEDAPIEEVFATSAEWEVGSSKQRVKVAREYLIKREKEALQYIKNEKLRTKSGLEMRALTHFVKNSSLANSLISYGLNSSEEREVRNAIRLIGDIKDISYLDQLEAFIADKKYLGTILSVYGEIADERCSNTLANFTDSENIYIRVITARSLRKINSELSISFLKQMKDDNCFLIKSMIRLLDNKNE